MASTDREITVSGVALGVSPVSVTSPVARAPVGKDGNRHCVRVSHCLYRRILCDRLVSET